MAFRVKRDKLYIMNTYCGLIVQNMFELLEINLLMLQLYIDRDEPNIGIVNKMPMVLMLLNSYPLLRLR